MPNTTICAVVLATLLALSLQGTPAQAQLARTFVSAATGNDANDCNRLTPCRTFQQAHNQTFSLGEITVLDPGGYGALTITKSISIINDGVGEAGMLVSGGAIGITISAPSDAFVSLRGITIQGIGFGGGTGLRFTSGAALTMTNCAIRSHTGNGIEFFPAAPSRLAVSNTIVADNGMRGIFVQPGNAGDARVVLSRVETYNNTSHGFVLDGSASVFIPRAMVADSIAANNGGTGILANTAEMQVVRSVSAYNGSGVVASAAVLRIGQSTVTGNSISTAGVTSYGDNNIDGNGGGNPAPPVIARK